MEWIKCSEEMPEIEVNRIRTRSVLIYCPNIKCTFTAVYCDTGKWEYFAVGCSTVMDDVSHWRPLPQPPEA